MKQKLPKIYSKNIYQIPYHKLKEQNIKLLLFDLDNTIISSNTSDIGEDTIRFFKELKQDFEIMIVSNSMKKRVSKIASKLELPYYSFSLKPLSKTYKKIKKKYQYQYEQMAMIGDQWYTDIFGANRLGICSVLVDPVSNYDFMVTKINRKLETKKLEKLKKYGFMKGQYYD